MIQQLSRALDFARRSIENPNQPFWQAVQELQDYLSGGPSKSGIQVTQESAIRLSAFWRGVRLLSETLASVPLCLYERLEPRGRRKAVEHPLFTLLHDEPNPDMTSFFAREVMQAQIVTHGNAYGAIRRDNGGRIREIWPLISNRVDPRRDQDGELVYWMTMNDSTREPWAPEDVLHVPGLSFDGRKGKSVLAAARDVIGSGLAVQDYGATFFKHGARPPGVVETMMPKLDPDTKKNLEETWLSGRNDNWHKVAFLPKNMKYVPAGIPPDDAQWLESKKFTVPEIARILGVPPHLLYDLDRATFSNIEMQSLEFVIYTMRQYFVRWEQELNRKLLTREERRSFYFEFNADGLMRGDAAARGTFYALGRQWGWFSANDVRELENRSDIGAAGDVYLTPFNMANAEELLLDGNGGQRALPARGLPPASPARAVREMAARTGVRGLRLRRRIRKAQVPVIEDRARLIVKREIGAIEKELKALLPGRNRRDVPALRNAIEEFYKEHAGYSGRKMQPIVQSYAEIIAGAMADELNVDLGDDLPPEVDRFVADYSKRFGIREAAEGRMQLLALAEEGDEDQVAEAIRGRLAEWDEKRPGKIAAIEATRELSAVAKVLYVVAGVTVLRWVANPGACPFCQAMDGRVAGVHQNFVAAGDGVDGGEGTDEPLVPSDNIGHPPLHDNCACLPGDARVSPAGRITAQSERWFDGEMFVIRAASGKELTCTPNHPVLTDRGWVAAETLDVGDYIVSSRAREWNAAIVRDNENMPPMIEEIARAFREGAFVTTMPVPGAAEQFHGDGRAGEITVVRSDRQLLREVQAALAQERSENPFILRSAPASSLTRQGAPASLRHAANAAFAHSMCRGVNRLTLSRSAAGPDEQLGSRHPAGLHVAFEQPFADHAPSHAEGSGQRKLGFSTHVALNQRLHVDRAAPRQGSQSVGLRPAAERDAPLQEPRMDRIVTDAERLGQGELALAGDVFMDQVVHVERYPFHGPVFNLQTSRGFFLAEGILTHNCDIVAD